MLTRHNVGFMAADFLAKSVGAPEGAGKQEHEALCLDFSWDSEKVKLVKPQGFMNLSGESVGPLSRFYKVEPQNILVVHDDMDIPFGQIRLKTSGGDGGHNGLKSLIEHLGTKDFPRVRIGVSRPPNPKMDPATYVLQSFNQEEQSKLPEIMNEVADSIECVIFEGMTAAMNKFNRAKE